MPPFAPPFLIEATPRTPAVTLDADKGLFVLEGESYPEDITSFYQPIRDALNAYLEDLKNTLKVEIKLLYFNSSSARMIMDIFASMNEKATRGQYIAIDWYCDPEDDITREFAEDISDGLRFLKFKIHDMPPPVSA